MIGSDNRMNPSAVHGVAAAFAALACLVSASLFLMAQAPVSARERRLAQRPPSRIIAGQPYAGPGTTTGFAVGNGLTAHRAHFGQIVAVAVDRGGNIFVADTLAGAKPQQYRCQVREIMHRSDIVRAVAGRGPTGQPAGPSAALRLPLGLCGGLAATHGGVVLVLDTAHNTLYTVRPNSGAVERLLGSPASRALYYPAEIALGPRGNVFIADTDNNRILRLNGQGRARVVAGTGKLGFSGDGGPAVRARLGEPTGIAVGAAGNIYVGVPDSGRIRVMSARTRRIWTFAGGGHCYLPNCPDGAPASRVVIEGIVGLATDACGNVYAAAGSSGGLLEVDRRSYTIRRLTAANADVTAVTVHGDDLIYADSKLHVLRETPITWCAASRSRP